MANFDIYAINFMVSNYFQTFLINPLFEDPVLFIKLDNDRRSLLVDCGNTNRLIVKDIRSISHIFITHSHIDHFIGLDNVIRANVGFEKTLYIFGPSGITKQVHCKLLGYSWNLIAENDLNLHITEIGEDKIQESTILSKDRFQEMHILGEKKREGNTIYCDKDFYVQCALLNHDIPCLAYAFIKRDEWHVKKACLLNFPHSPGPWLKNLQNLASQNAASDSIVEVGQRQYTLGELKNLLLEERKGEKIGYVTDTICSPNVEEAVIGLAKDADVLFCECHFLNEDKERADVSYHLTARQSGMLARKACVKKVIGFHYSHRYTAEQSQILEKELQQAFQNGEPA